MRQSGNEHYPLHRLGQLMTQEADAPAPGWEVDRPGILLTGATGFLAMFCKSGPRSSIRRGCLLSCEG
jgi:hypothetical protein